MLHGGQRSIPLVIGQGALKAGVNDWAKGVATSMDSQITEWSLIPRPPKDMK